MSFLGFGKSKSEIDTTVPPDRTKRAKCWAARDAFFKCLDDNGIVDSLKNEQEAKAKCNTQFNGFDQDCVPSWVEYFKKRRVMEDKKARALEGLEKEGAQNVGALQTKAGK